jgi:catechol 2,3-dioxygenase-like lactoylglutathione lyase family enzyme
MLGDAHVHPTIPVTDLGKARAFYEGTLGLSPEFETPVAVMYSAGSGTDLLVFTSAGPSNGNHTTMGFKVDDIEKEVADLKGRGVEFLEYDLPSLKTVNSIADTGPIRSAWFRDPEGNILGVVQLPR